MEAVYSSETVVKSYRTIKSHIPKEGILLSTHSGNFTTKIKPDLLNQSMNQYSRFYLKKVKELRGSPVGIATG
jgi:hypothetical protein